ncbi:MAG: hypothetical protein IPO78_07860 [Saprospiraceae bacterium]|nr:hypothetical protein [Saprospiraceae bacterium]
MHSIVLFSALCRFKIVAKIVIFTGILLFFNKSWIVFKSIDHFFQISIPALPRIESKEIQTELGTILQTSYVSIDTLNTSKTYQIISSLYPAQFMNSTSLLEERNTVNNTLIDAMQNYLKGQLIYKEFGQLKGIECCWFLIKYEEKSLKACLIWKGNQLISLFFYSNYKERLIAESNEFFESFKLLD